MGEVYDLRDIPSAGEPLPTGRYLCRVEKQENGAASENAKNPGALMTSIEWRVDEGEFSGRALFSNLVWVPNALPFVKAALRALGFSDDDMAAVDPENLDLVGKRAYLTVTQRQNPETGDTVNNVKSIKSLDATESILPR